MIARATRAVRPFLILAIISVVFAVIWWLGTWKSPDANFAGQTTIHTCVHSDDRKRHITLGTGGGNNFDIYWVKSSQPSCLNPYFPAIHIQASQPHNAWVHIVYTDSKAPGWRAFIDAANKDSASSAYPFYTDQKDFYDAPLWSYSLFNKPLCFWKGHAFAVQVDHQKKSIHCMGGIGWGFELSHFRVRPKATAPQLLKKEDWERAWQLLQEKLPGYNQTYEDGL
jgi:hypothetical protein